MSVNHRWFKPVLRNILLNWRRSLFFLFAPWRGPSLSVVLCIELNHKGRWSGINKELPPTGGQRLLSYGMFSLVLKIKLRGGDTNYTQNSALVNYNNLYFHELFINTYRVLTPNEIMVNLIMTHCLIPRFLFKIFFLLIRDTCWKKRKWLGVSIFLRRCCPLF